MKATNKTESDMFNKTVPDSLFLIFFIFFTFTCTTAEFYIDDDGDDFNLATCCRECGCCFKGV